MSRKYANPPVVEALCEIELQGGRWDSTVPGRFFERIRDRFPDKEDHLRSPIELMLEGSAATTRVHAPQQIVRFHASDRSRLVQLGRDLIVVNQLRPYPHFEEWRPIVEEMLGLYQELASPAGIAKLALRYLNHLVLPETDLNLARWLHLYPGVPAQVGRGISDDLRAQFG